MSARPVIERREGRPRLLPRALLYVLFGAVLLIPKSLSLRRRRKLWNAIRAGVALLGATLVVVPMAGTSSWFVGACGLALFFLALLAPPAKQQKSVDEQARELGALVVVNGGRFRAPEGKPVPARLFVAPERVYALDLEQRPLVEIHVGAVSLVRAEEASGGWRLRIEWQEHTAEFLYGGVFAEHLARVAESTVRGVLRPALPVIQRSQAAGV